LTRLDAAGAGRDLQSMLGEGPAGQNCARKHPPSGSQRYAVTVAISSRLTTSRWQVKKEHLNKFANMPQQVADDEVNQILEQIKKKQAEEKKLKDMLKVRCVCCLVFRRLESSLSRQAVCSVSSSRWFRHPKAAVTGCRGRVTCRFLAGSRHQYRRNAVQRRHGRHGSGNHGQNSEGPAKVNGRREHAARGRPEARSAGVDPFY